MKKRSFLLRALLPLLLCLALTAPTLAAGASGYIATTPSLQQMHVDARSAILVDTTYDEILFEQNAHEKLYPASITKVMTALLTIEAVESGAFSWDQPITASETVNDRMIAGASTQNIKPGEVMPLRDVLACALIPSANEACNILAETVGGSITEFVELMNRRADELGCENTHFTNPHGLHDDEHYTTAYDIYLICNEAMRHETFRDMVTSKSYEVSATNLADKRILHDTNALISNFNKVGYLYEYATGIKTGYTPEAGYCLASSASRDGRSLIAVVLGCTRAEGSTGSGGFTYFTESTRLLEWGFSNFARRTIIDAKRPLLEIPVTLSDQADHVVAQPSGSIEATLPNDATIEDFEPIVESNYDTLEAPVEKGMVLGKVTLRYGGRDYGSLDLVAVDSVARSELLYRLDRIQKFFSQLWVKILLVVVIVLILVLVGRFLLFGRRRSRRGYAYSGGRRGRRR